MNSGLYFNGVLSLGGDPELRFSASGNAYARFNGAENRRAKVDGTWQNVGTDWYNVTVFGELAENVASTLSKGNRAHVSGRVERWIADEKDENGYEVIRGINIIADNVAVDLRFVTAEISWEAREAGSGGFNSGPSDEEPF